MVCVCVDVEHRGRAFAVPCRDVGEARVVVKPHAAVLVDVPAEELDSDFDLLTGGVVDSLGLLKMVAWLEDEFDVGVDESELGPESFRTVAAIKEYVDQARAAT